VIIVALKTWLEVKLEICIYIKCHFCIDPTTILVSHQAVSPHFATKCRPCLWWSIWLISCVSKHTLHILILVLLIACVTNQCSQFILCCQWQYVFNKLCAKWCLHLGKLKKHVSCYCGGCQPVRDQESHFLLCYRKVPHHTNDGHTWS